MKTRFFHAFLAAGCLLFGGCDSSTAPAGGQPGREEWQPLFNGVSLDGWEPKIAGFDLNDNYQNTFSVSDSMIKVSYDGYSEFGNRFGHLFYKQPFSFYKLRVEYRFVGEQAKGGPDWAWRNSGAMLHGQSAASMTKEQDFPISLEAQFLGGDGKNERHTLNLCTPGTHVHMGGKLVEDHCIDSKSKTVHGDEWVRAEFLVLGDSLVQHVLDGEVVFEYTKPVVGGGAVGNFDPAAWQDGKPLTEGSISLQAESHPVHFRKVELLNLEGCTDPKAKNYKAWFVKSKKSACVYN